VLALISISFIVSTYQDPLQTHELPWWKGLIASRHAVVFRAVYRSARKLVEKMPILGEVFKIFSGGRNLFRFLKTGAEPLRFADVVLIVAFVILAACLTYAVDALFVWEVKYRFKDEEWMVAKPEDFRWWSRIIAWTGCGVAFYILGIARSQSLFVFAGLFFIFAPAVRSLRLSTLPILNGQSLFAAGLAIVCCSLIRLLVLRVRSKGGPARNSAPTIAEDPAPGHVRSRSENDPGCVKTQNIERRRE